VAGDRARLLADGSVELLGRDSVTINTGGEKVYAEEVEAAVKSHPAVLDAIVVGRPHERWGQEVVAVVALRPGVAVDDEDLRAAAAAGLARYKLPKAYVRVAQVQRTASGKADYAWARIIAAG
jgi:fatty-acyl-CoA synthase